MKPKHTLRDQVLPVLLVAFFILLALIGVWTAGSPRGADTWGHLFRAEYLAGVMTTVLPSSASRFNTSTAKRDASLGAKSA